MEFEPGLQISGFLVSEELGAGGFAKVFRAEPVDGGASVALKVAVRPELVRALRDEGAVLRRLRSPHFVRVLEEHLETDPPFLVLEHCPGGDLRQLLAGSPNNRLEPEQAEAVVTTILEGMAFAHDEGIVNGDLKPENVLLDASGHPKIADLGLSRVHRRRLVLEKDALAQSLPSEDGKLRGTLDYVAPEVRGGLPLTPTSDVFALGVLFYELLVGRRPLGYFQLPGAALRREGIEIPAHLDRVVTCALARDPLQRYPDASVMLADLMAGAEGIELDVRAPTNAAMPVEEYRAVNDALYFVVLACGFAVPAAIVLVVHLLLRVIPYPVADVFVAVALAVVAALVAGSAARKLHAASQNT